MLRNNYIYWIHFSNEIVPTESIIYPLETIEKSLKFIMDALNWDETPNFVTFESFRMPTEIITDVEFEWDKTISIPREEFQAQLNYDLATYNFFKENYIIAIPYFMSTMKCINEIDNSIGFLRVKSSHLEGFLIASNSKNGHKFSLMKQLKISIVSHFVVNFLPMLFTVRYYYYFIVGFIKHFCAR